jgi:cation:H+ antiporter
VLLTLPLLATTLTEFTVFAIHPVSLVIPIVYVSGLIVTRTLSKTPMWRPVSTDETRYQKLDYSSSPPAGRQHRIENRAR